MFSLEKFKDFSTKQGVKISAVLCTKLGGIVVLRNLLKYFTLQKGFNANFSKRAFLPVFLKTQY